MSVTERLRALLDERGVEYKTDDRQIVRYTDWGRWFFAEPLGAEPNTLGAQCELVCMPVTPEQAVEATLGQGTCRNVGDPSDFCCSECGVRMFTEANDTYTMIASDERTIIKQPNYCPNCGKRVVGWQ